MNRHTTTVRIRLDLTDAYTTTDGGWQPTRYDIVCSCGHKTDMTTTSLKMARSWARNHQRAAGAVPIQRVFDTVYVMRDGTTMAATY